MAESVSAPLPNLVYETVIREVGTRGFGPPCLRLARHTRSTTIEVSMEMAQAFATHIYGRVRVTVEVLPPTPGEAEEPEG